MYVCHQSHVFDGTWYEHNIIRYTGMSDIHMAIFPFHQMTVDRLGGGLHQQDRAPTNNTAKFVRCRAPIKNSGRVLSGICLAVI